MKAVILAGGYGTRLSEETGVRPKPMVEIGGKPILWHIMKIYSALRDPRIEVDVHRERAFHCRQHHEHSIVRRNRVPVADHAAHPSAGARGGSPVRCPRRDRAGVEGGEAAGSREPPRLTTGPPGAGQHHGARGPGG
jgi:hypothetical protein